MANSTELKFFFVNFVHHDLALWREHLDAHVLYLRSAVAEGVLRASGPVRISGDASRRGALIFTCANREQLIASISRDPFYIHGVIDEMTIVEWDPVFGVFAAESSGGV